jgi:hypothetical protein
MDFHKTLSVLYGEDPAAIPAAEIFARCLSERCQVAVHINHPGGFPIVLDSSDSALGEGFAIDPLTLGVKVRSGSGLGLIHGLGRLMRDGDCGADGFALGTWRGVSQPALPVRGIYFATHFHNWYHVAPVESIQGYVEELALWGTNTLAVWFDMHHFNGIHDPAAQTMLRRLTAVLGAAKRIGMKTVGIFLANEAYADSPEALRADWTAGHDGYFNPPGGHYHVELCPSKPGSMEILLRWAEERLQAFQPAGLDYICIWPYDQGGCTCKDCAPWGVNGYLRCAEPLARMYKRYFPQGQVILSTWYFDHFTAGEWVGLADKFSKKPDWVDWLLADDYGDNFPSFPALNGAPGDLPVVTFPEISMYRCLPWGGYGANPLPDHFQAVWNQCSALASGGFPYSEGIYEDLNKAIYAQFFWNPRKPAWETVREYLRYEFGAATVDRLSQAVAILEQNHPRQAGETRIDIERLDDAERAWNLVREAGEEMGTPRSQLWRWRMLFLRANIDAELARTGGELSGSMLEEAFAELTRLSCAQDALEGWVRPPVMKI